MRMVAGILLALLASFASPARAGDGLPDAPRDLLRLFATCTGRLSALMEHQRLFDGPGSEVTARLRDDLADLAGALAGAVPDLPDHQAMAWRVEAKAAAAGLFAQGAFGQADRRAQAQEMAAARVAECRALLPNA
ncbi:MAG: hypothetical protein MUF73_16695 [Rhodobacteraceae bacterium]|nr:hypothetical protein [Paracoccaceae bacterium]